MGFKNIFRKKDKVKKRLSPRVGGVDGLGQSHPMYQYARNEFAQTVAPGTSNDNGKPAYPPLPQQQHRQQQQQHTDLDDGSVSIDFDQHAQMQGRRQNESDLPPTSPASANTPSSHDGSPRSEYMIFSAFSQTSTGRMQQEQLQYHSPTIVDATYAEQYGDAYLGGSIRYIYPSGYQSMRPRGGPWKLSIFITVMFTWLSVFIIGHCSDRYGDVQYYDEDTMDDQLVIETRWCGSRLLYMMWVVSMSITGMAAAYMAIIGYIKLRDFAVANGRSQPPGMAEKSDYYVKIRDGPATGRSLEEGSYQRTIYQSDGTPQFWGGHIYRPTQAAVAVTSR
eukprot:scaffold22575_cov141-Cylindrotheca_fusiformis.AAC.36